MSFEKAADGKYHPETIEELSALVARAHENGTPVRANGACMSYAPSIHTDGFASSGAASTGMEVVLDRLCRIEFEEEARDHAIVRVEAGCLLGRAYDDPVGQSWKKSLTHALQERGYALGQLSGVSHQAIGGFLMTGSAGGSAVHAIHDSILELELVDGTGRLRVLRRDAEDPRERELFLAAGVSMGLLGILARVRLRVGPTYNVVGRELTVGFADAPVDLANTVKGAKPRLTSYFQDTEYSRILWWPQRAFDRVQMWECRRAPPAPGFVREPFEVLKKWESLAGSLVYTVLGNLDDLEAVPEKLEPWRKVLERHRDGGTGGRIARLVAGQLDELLQGRSGRLLGAALKKLAPHLIDKVLGVFVGNGERRFQDTWMSGLPMDNSMEEALWRTDFTELWIPMDQAEDAMFALHNYFTENDAREAYRRTGPFVVEIYPGPASDFWMSPGYGTPCLRVNVFWFAKWAGNPDDTFFPPFHRVLRPFAMRVHWGKHLPMPAGAWVEHYRRVLPKLDAFLALREELDPKQIFVTTYWRQHLGIPPPAPRAQTAGTIHAQRVEEAYPSDTALRSSPSMRAGSSAE